MLDEYLVELSQYGDVDLAYPWFDAYWRGGQERWPYLIEGGDQATLGFALVNTHPPVGLTTDYAMAEFYVVPSARRLRVGHEAAAATFRLHLGRWALSVMVGNGAAQRFWPAAIAAAGARNIEHVITPDGDAYRFVIAATR